MKLTDDEKVIFKMSLKYAPFWDLPLLMWWGLVNQKKQRILMDWLMAGMAWRYAMINAKKKNSPTKDR